MKLLLSLLIIVLLYSCGNKEIYKDVSQPVDKRVEDLMQRMTLDEKLILLSGDSTGFATKTIKRFNIPSIFMTDGPLGVRWKKSTAFPSAQAFAATWDTALVYEISKAMAQETKAHGRDYLLGPCVCINRFPLGGRNFESYGEDPFLSSRMVVSWVKGLQSQKVIGAVKHFAMNDQEWKRDYYTVIADERAMREIHLPMFEAAVKEGGVWSVMTAYNLVNGQHCGENQHLIHDILKNEWGFKGFVISDWTSLYNTANSANAGLDLEMPSPKYYQPDSLKKAMKAGRITEEVINDKVRRILRVAFLAGLFDTKNIPDTTIIYSESHQKLALLAAQEGITLLKNDNILPLDDKKIKTIALFGLGAANTRGGGGSSRVEAWQTISPLQGIKERAGKNIEVLYSPGTNNIVTTNVNPISAKSFFMSDKKTSGLQAEYFNNINLEGKPVLMQTVKDINFDFGMKSPAMNVIKDNFAIRFTGNIRTDTTGTYVFSTLSDDGVRLYIDNKLVLENWLGHAPTVNSGEFKLTAGKLYSLKLEYFDSGGGAEIKLGWTREKGNPTQEIADLARKSDVAIVFAGTDASLESEALDVASMNLPDNQLEMIEQITKINPNTIVVLNGGTPLNSSYLTHVKGLIHMYYSGQETGHAIASILFGDVNPSGKLPFSYIKDESQSPAFKDYKDPGLKIKYDEGIFVGYRYLDKNNINPVFPFGFGLSYASFEYTDLKVNKTGNFACDVTITIKNTGKIKGDEVIQLYVSDKECSVARPLKELKGFARVALNPGEIKTITLKLKLRDFSFWDVKTNNWKAEPGVFEVMIGASSRDIRLKKDVVF